MYRLTLKYGLPEKNTLVDSLLNVYQDVAQLSFSCQSRILIKTPPRMPLSLILLARLSSANQQQASFLVKNGVPYK